MIIIINLHCIVVRQSVPFIFSFTKKKFIFRCNIDSPYTTLVCKFYFDVYANTLP